MKNANIVRIVLAVLVIGLLIASAFIDVNQQQGAADPVPVGSYTTTSDVATAPAGGFSKITSFDSFVNYLNGNVAWGIFMCVLLVGTGVYFSIRGKFFQVVHFRHMWKNTIGKLFKKEKAAASEDKNAITPFQALTTAIAATVGTGNIAGVTGAIVLGGPGAVFWMWVAAVFGMFTKFAEVTLAVKYREKNAKGEWVGGPMYYIKNGLGKKWKWLGTVFAVFGSLAAFGIGSMTQVNSIAGAVVTAIDSFTAAPVSGTSTAVLINWIVGGIVALVTGLVILGGIKRIGRITEKIVPFMSLFYIIGALIVVIAHIDSLGMALGSIFKGAFTTEAAVGGVTGFVLMNAIKRGVGRGVFSNEAGLGSAPIAHSLSSETNPVKQGLYGMFEVFVDTIVICTLTSLVVLVSNVVPWGDASLAGAVTTISSFGTVFGPVASSVFIAIALLFFAFSTILSWSLYGSRCFGYLTHGHVVPLYQVIFLITVFIGAGLHLSTVWNIADTLNGLMAAPNLIAVLALSGVVIKELKTYWSEQKALKRTLK